MKKCAHHPGCDRDCPDNCDCCTVRSPAVKAPKRYEDIWRRFVKHRKTHKRHGRFCAKCVEYLADLEEAAKAEDGEGE